MLEWLVPVPLHALLQSQESTGSKNLKSKHDSPQEILEDARHM